jgi:hypothetical protein
VFIQKYMHQPVVFASVTACTMLVYGGASMAQTVIPPQPSGAPFTLETGQDNGYIACAEQALNAELRNAGDESETEDCAAHPQALTIVHVGSGGADCEGRNRKAISKEENRPCLQTLLVEPLPHTAHELTGGVEPFRNFRVLHPVGRVENDSSPNHLSVRGVR